MSRVYCESCQSMVRSDDVHSCFDAARLVRIKDAERAVLEAAKAAEDTLVGMAHVEAVYGSQLADNVLALIDATAALRALGGCRV